MIRLSMIRLSLAASLILPNVLWATGAPAAEFTPAQRAEIVGIVRDALKQDPSILRDAITALQADDGERAEAATRAAIVQAKGQLVTAADPVAGDPHGDVTIVEFLNQSGKSEERNSFWYAAVVQVCGSSDAAFDAASGSVLNDVTTWMRNG